MSTYKNLYGKQFGSNSSLKFMNCRLWGKEFGSIFVRNGIIVDSPLNEDVFEIDCDGLVISPGFIDVQTNGGFGIDFSTYKSDHKYIANLGTFQKKILSHGVTSFLPTVITSSQETYHKVLPLLESKSCDYASIVGVHAEGPFISKKKKGCHPVEFIRDFEPNVGECIGKLYGSGLQNVKMVTLAPELEFAQDAVRWFTSHGIIVSIGHSDSSSYIAKEAVKSGASCITHLYNAMRTFHHRETGIIDLLVAEECSENVFFGLISDGVHCDEASVRMAYRANPNGIMLVTDSMEAMGMPDGIYKIGDQIVNKNGYEAKLDNGTLAGSVADLPHCIRTFKMFTGCSLETALKAATEVPARVMNLKTKGLLNPGHDADFVLLDDDVNVKAVFIAGRLVFMQ